MLKTRGKPKKKREEEKKIEPWVRFEPEMKAPPTEPLELTFDIPRGSSRTMDTMFKEVRVNVFEYLITYMMKYGGKQQLIVEHASVFDLRRVPEENDEKGNEKYMSEVTAACAFFVTYCSKKKALKFDPVTKKAESVVRRNIYPISVRF